MRSFVARYPVLVFVGLALAVQFAMIGFVWLTVADGLYVSDVPLAHNVFRLRVFVPILLVTYITWYLEGMEGIKNLYGTYLNWRVPAKWYALAVSWKFIMAGIAIILAWLIWDVAPDWVIQGNSWNLFTHMPFIIGIALVEETSWIRFAITRMQMRFSAFWSAMIVGNCWATWYLPMNLIDVGTPLGVPDIVFHSGVVSLTVLLLWVYNTTRSGTVLLVMQIVSNMAFFWVPVLPHEGLPDYRIIAYAWVFVAVAVMLILVFGPEHLSRRKRVRWDEGLNLGSTSRMGSHNNGDPDLRSIRRRRSIVRKRRAMRSQ
ncbi:MAG: hypothetical protein KA175_00455 [Flavobacteriales bacterium]|nr:hypothetical protein [Flavobacteriales bacterium]MBP6696053.1 hypothetical protein [Flavobacteriales bacterium]